MNISLLTNRILKKGVRMIGYLYATFSHWKVTSALSAVWEQVHVSRGGGGKYRVMQK